jgi:hypothetical protein
MVDRIGVIRARFIRDRCGGLESGVVGDINPETNRKAFTLK